MSGDDELPKENAIETALQAGAALVDGRRIGETPYAVVPAGYKLLNLEKMLGAPLRKRGRVNALTVVGFIDYFKRHDSPGGESGVEVATIYADRRKHAFTAIFDDDQEYKAGWRQHLLTYTCPKSVEWLAWWAANENKKDQEAFARFIEDNLPDIIEPDSATILEISRTLEAKKAVSFASSIRLANGANELKFEETIEGTAAKGTLRIPDSFKIGIPVFVGGPPYSITCRLRYRIPPSQGRGLTMWFEMERPQTIIDAAFAELFATVAEGTGVTPIEAEVPVDRPSDDDD